jgi:type IV fimbrial biogenesis protein FimT
MRRGRAFTLIELVIVVALISIIAAVAVPAFGPIVEDSRLATNLNRLRTGLQFARNHAVATRIRTVVCKTNASLTSCVTSGDWSNGWLIFEDPDGDGSCADTDGDSLCDADGGPVLLVERGLEPGMHLDATGNLKYRVPFDATGATPGYMGTFSLCSDAMPTKSRGLTVYATGRVRLAHTSKVSCN